jgi:transcription elongation GreA/GreB family factor
MSRAFVKEDAEEQASELLPERPQSPHPNYVTPQGQAALQKQLQALQEERRALLDRDDDFTSRDHLRVIERDLRYVQERLDRAIVIDPASQPADEVAFGAAVRTVDDNDEERAFTIVGEDEAEPSAGRISWVSPLAKSLIGARVGETVTWKRPTGDLHLEILSIQYPGA